jgi:diguanylate cyclase (GGDEF)-like protein
MHSGSIVKQSSAKARRTVLAAFVGVAIIAAGFFVERSVFQLHLGTASQRLIKANFAANQILLADERLTMSASIAATTGEDRWINRYDNNLPLIDEAIGAAAELASPAVAERFDAETRASNDRLVALERASFERMRSGDSQGAMGILEGEEYARHKKILSEGTARFVDDVINSVASELAAVEQRAVVVTTGTLAVAIISALVLWRIFNRSLIRSEVAFLEAERKIQRLAMSDTLTGLANRVAMRHALHAAIERADLNRSKLAILMIDLDRFKPVNDRHGHLIGDMVLKEVAGRIASTLRDVDIRARYGGDEFVAVIEYEGGDDLPLLIGSRIIEQLSSPMCFAGLSLQIGASVGCAVYPANALTEEDLIRKADIALYRAKLEGRGKVRAYDADLDSDTEARAQMEGELRDGIRNGEVIPYFQPLVDLTDGQIRGFEVLSRWQHPTKGIIPPATFIPLAEDTGQISDLMVSVLKRACMAARVLPSDVTISVNIAPQQLQDEWLPAKILGALSESGFSPQRLEVELTEHALVADLSSAKRVIASLKALGIKMALDDFGTGYSSLCYLAELPFDTLKIDRSFIRTLHDRPESAKIVAAIVGLGESLGVTIVAEGIEAERDAALLREIGCSLGQGFLYSKPVPASELEKLVRGPSVAQQRRALVQ